MYNIDIDYTRDNLFDKHGLTRLKDSYLHESETSPQERFAYVSSYFATDHEHAKRMYEYSSKHWISYSTPLLSFHKSKKSLPISCFLGFVPDTKEGLIESLSETNWLSMMGGGVGVYFSTRSSDKKSVGVMPHLKTYDSSVLAYKQGSRRGSYATYLDISHPDIIQFIEMRKPTGDPNIRCQNLHHGINITNDFMEIIEKAQTEKIDDSWNLIDPHSKKIVETVSAKDLWQKILQTRLETGEPYIHFIDNTNDQLPEFLKKQGLLIRQSNLCTEILEPTNEERTAVCCLLSLNVNYYHEWKHIIEQFLRDCVEFLDNVLSYFIENAPPQLHRAVFSAKQERSIGIGSLGWHSLLQKSNISFEGLAAKLLNTEISSNIRKYTDKATIELGKIRGEAPDAKGTGRRNALCIAIAPNASTGIIIGNTSSGIEAFSGNIFRQDTTSGFYTHRNPNLHNLLNKKKQEGFFKQSIDEVWSSIMANDGSVQHLTFLSDDEKSIYKTAFEIDQLWVIEHAADRQVFIDQGQSLNLFFYPDTNIKYLHAVHFAAWKKGLKTLYYCRSKKISKLDNISSKIERKKIEDDINVENIINGEDCIACQ